MRRRSAPSNYRPEAQDSAKLRPRRDPWECRAAWPGRGGSFCRNAFEFQRCNHRETHGRMAEPRCHRTKRRCHRLTTKFRGILNTHHHFAKSCRGVVRLQLLLSLPRAKIRSALTTTAVFAPQILYRGQNQAQRSEANGSALGSGIARSVDLKSGTLWRVRPVRKEGTAEFEEACVPSASSKKKWRENSIELLFV